MAAPDQKKDRPGRNQTADRQEEYLSMQADLEHAGILRDNLVNNRPLLLVSGVGSPPMGSPVRTMP